MAGQPDTTCLPTWLRTEFEEGHAWFTIGLYGQGVRLVIEKERGLLETCPGDYIVRGFQGEIYPCESSIFKETYIKID